CIASGSLLLTCRPTDIARLLASYAEQRIPCAEIGTVMEAERGLVLVDGKVALELPVFARDEIARLFEAGERGRACKGTKWERERNEETYGIPGDCACRIGRSVCRTASRHT